MNGENRSLNFKAFSYLQDIWDWLTRPARSISDPTEQRSARLAASFLIIISLLDFIGALARIPRVGLISAFTGTIGYSLFPTLLAYGLSRTKWYRASIFLFSAAFSSIAYISIILEGAAADISALILIYVPLSLVVASTFLSSWAVFLLTGLNVGAFFLTTAFGIQYTPDNFGAQAGIVTTLGLVLIALTNFRNNSERLRLESLRLINQQLDEARLNLEQRVTERTKALEISSEISRRLASILDVRELASAVVNQVQSAYNYYYAQIYLFDEARENLVLTAGTGEAGAAMLQRGHSLPKGRGLVGRAAENKQSILVSDTSQDPNWLPNDLLPDTKAEAAIPIFIGEQVLGVLDVQDSMVGDITNTDITLLESLAAQVAISLQNARQYARAEAALQEARSLVENAPEAVVIIDLTTGLFTDPNENAVKLYGLPREELIKVGPAQMSPPRQPDGRDSTEAAVEKIGEAMQGKTPVFDWTHRNAQGKDIACEIHLIRMPGDKPRVRATVMNITERKQLQDLTTQRARQQEALNTITQKIQAATTIEDALQVAARELGHALGQKPTLVALEPDSSKKNQ